MRSNAIPVYETTFSKLEKVLVDGRDWIMGDQYTLAEINFAPYVARLEYMGLLEIWIENRPKVSSWWNRIKARLAYQRGVSDRLTPLDIEPMHRFGGAIHLRVAELRQDYLREFVITD